MFDIVDNYGGSIPLVFIAIFECVAIMWFYGYDRFAFDIKYMLGKELGFYWKFTWKYASPSILALIFVYSLINFQPMKVSSSYDFFNYHRMAKEGYSKHSPRIKNFSNLPLLPELDLIRID